MNSTQKTYLWIIIFLSIIGIILSLDLTKSHIISYSTNTPCDISPSVSCSLVNTSTYSELLGVPVALFGVLWFVALGILALAILFRADHSHLITALIYWNGIGIVFVIYLIIAEFILQTICPLCTVIHLFVVISLALSVLLYRSHPVKSSLKDMFKQLKYWIILFALLNLVPIIFFNTIY